MVGAQQHLALSDYSRLFVLRRLREKQGEPRDCVTGKCLALPVAAATDATKTTAAAQPLRNGSFAT